MITSMRILKCAWDTYIHFLFPFIYLVLHESCKFNVEMCWEPVGGFQVVQKLWSSRAPQSVALHFLPEEGFHFEELLLVSIVIDAPWPVMGHKYIDGTLQLSGQKAHGRNTTYWQRSLEITWGSQLCFILPYKTVHIIIISQALRGNHR